MKNGLHLALLWIGYMLFGLIGTGIAYAATHLFYWVMMWWISLRSMRFEYSAPNRRLLLLNLSGIVTVFFLSYLWQNLLAQLLGVATAIGIALYSARKICVMDRLEWLPLPIRSSLRLAPPGW
jgi:O-antigen/teichoic acid export membrane protein